MSSKEEFVSELSKLNPSSTFLVLHRYRNAQGELADHNIVFHISYKNAVQKSLEIIQSMTVRGSYYIQAKKELIQSFTTSLQKTEEMTPEEIEPFYRRFLDDSGNYIKGVKMHKETGDLHLYGFCHLKKVIERGIYKDRNSSPLTLAKNELRKECPVSKFRQFRILPIQVEKIRVQHMSLLPPDTV